VTFVKDVHALLDFSVDWSAWLADAETISTSEWTVPDGLTKGAESDAAGVATVWLSGGTAGVTYRVRNKVSTSDSRVDERSFFVRVTER